MWGTRALRSIVITVATLGLVTATLTVPVTAAVLDDDTERVQNLTVSAVQTDFNRKFVEVTWDKPELGFFQSVRRYRVAYWNDWRPQYWIRMITPLQQATIKNLRGGRDYTVVVQADTGSGWGKESIVRFTVPGSSDVPWIVSLGDSFISGEGGRWAGNTDKPQRADTGAQAYNDVVEGESIFACHRSASALVHIGVARSLNLACSGAITRSQVNENDWWKPGIDEVSFSSQVNLGPGVPAVGQVRLLEDFAEDEDVDVRAVVLSIGGNNFNFAGIVQGCVQAFLLGNEDGCRGDPEITRNVNELTQAMVTNDILAALENIRSAMNDAGHPDGTWTLVYQMYPQPITGPENMRYTEEGLRRQSLGGCGFWDADAGWAVNTVLTTINATIRRAAQEFKRRHPNQRIVLHDISGAFAGHELCNRNVYRVAAGKPEDREPEDSNGVQSWRSPQAADLSEWVKDIELSPSGGATLEEGFHPNYWGQMALRNCLRKVWNGGNIVSGGKCTPQRGLNGRGEPNMKFTPMRDLTLL